MKTDRQDTDEALSRLNEAQRLAKVGSWELDLQTNHLVWSDEIFRMFEVDQTRFDASYEAFLAAIHPDDRAAVDAAYTAALTTHKPYEIVHRLRMADGRIKYVRETCESFFDDEGRPLRSVGTVQDISDLYRAELELREHREHLEELVHERTARLTESERELRRAQQIARLGHWSANMVRDDMIWSEEVYRIFGREPAQFQPSYQSFLTCVHPDDRSQVKSWRAELLRLGRTSVDHRVILPDGSVRWVHEEAQLERDAGGAPLRLAGAVQDITERKQTEDELIRAKNEAEHANRAKSEFLSRMSHELRTPMNAILGFAQVLELSALKAEQLEYVREIQRAGDHLLELIDDLLDLSRIEAGKMSATLRPVLLRAVAADAAQFTQPLYLERRITLLDNCDDRAAVLADPKRLKQILVNLLSNAAKYNVVGGNVRISCRAVAPERVRIEVTDTGPGIGPDKVATLFRPFERLGAELGAVQGTGIGLALSKQMAELMGGALGVDSTPGGGSTFWVELAASPAGQEPQPVAPVEAATTPPRPPLTLLYVEDNPANLRVVELMLRVDPHARLLAATTGEAGLELARLSRPDAILLDIHLPGLDGYAVFELLKNDPATRDIPVIALSADAMPVDVDKGLKAGFVRYLTKPITLEALMEAMNVVREAQGDERSGAMP